MKILYFLLLIAIPTWGLDGKCPENGLQCILNVRDNMWEFLWRKPRLYTLDCCQDDYLQKLRNTPNLRWLTVLHCESNFSSSHLAEPPNLEVLRLRLGNVTELPRLGNMSKLEKLDLWSNRIERVANGTFQGVANLTELYLQDNLIRELPEDVFHPLKKLKLLDLSRNQISQLSTTFLPNDSKLIALYLRENPLVTLGFSPIFHPRSIHEIDLTDCREMRGELRLPFKVHTLTLSGSGLESVDAPWLIKLKAAKSKVNNLVSVPHLKELNLRGSNLHFLVAGEILASHQMLETVDLSNNSVSFIPGDDDQRLWANFRKLNLSRNGLMHLPPNCPLFGVLLTSLDLSYNKLRIIDMAAFEGAYELESLFLQGNQLYNFDYQSDKLFNLKELALYENDFDEKYCTEMKGYFEHNPMIIHSSSRVYVCRDTVENYRENSSINKFDEIMNDINRYINSHGKIM